MNAPRLTGSRCLCRTCGQRFNSVSMFDRHRVGVYPSRRCLTTVELSQHGFKLNLAGFWIRAHKLAQDAQNARSGAGATHMAAPPHG